MKIRTNNDVKISGTIGDLTYFVLNGVQYARRKSTFKLKEKLKDPKYAHCKKNNERFGKANKLAGIKYATLSETEKQNKKFGGVLKDVYQLLKEGKTDEEIIRSF